MAYTLTPLATDTFHRANEEPLNPANWTVNTGGSGDLAVVSNACLGQTSTGGGLEFYTAVSAPANQYASLTVGTFLANSGVNNSELALIIRSSTLDFTSGYILTLTGNGDGTSDIVLSIQGGSSIGTVTGITVNVGDVMTAVAVGSTIAVLYNNVSVISVADTTFVSGINVGLLNFLGVVQADTSATLFVVGGASIATSNYSVPDCRNYGHFPNGSKNVNGTLTYTVQTSSNSAVPGTDSRKAGAPVDSSTQPQNSRTPGTYGPGE